MLLIYCMYDIKFLKTLCVVIFVHSGRRGKPAERMIYSDPEHLQVLYWCEPEEDATIPSIEALRVDGKDNKRSVSLVNVLEIRRGIDMDPLKPGYCGTAVLRKHCEPVHFAYSFSLITSERLVHSGKQLH